MEGLLNFLADYYIWFAGVSVFFAFALIGLVYESKKKKKAENKTADAVTQPVQAAPAPQTANPGVIVADNTQGEVVAGQPTLSGLEANTDNFNNLNETAQPQTLVIDDNGQTPAPAAGPSVNIDGTGQATGDTPAPSAEPTLVIDDPNAAPSAEPTLVIEDPNAAPAAETVQPVGAAPAATPVAPETQTLGNPGQPPV